jgi:hypothetical protein
MIFRLGELFCGPNVLTYETKTAGSIKAYVGAGCLLPHHSDGFWVGNSLEILLY